MESTADLIHFDGAFTPADKGLLCRTVREIEGTLPLTLVPDEAGCPWIMVTVRISPDTTYYLAHRMGYPLFLRAHSVQEMVHQIRSTWVQSVEDTHPAIARRVTDPGHPP